MSKVKLDFYTENDLQFLHELLSDSETKKYLPLMYTTDIEQSNLRLAMRLMDKECEYANRFLIKDLLTEKPVGEISGRYDRDIPSIMNIAIAIHPSYRGKGFAKEGISEFMKYMSENNKDITKFRLEILDTNFASIEVARKLKFKLAEKSNDNMMQYWEKDAR